MFVASFLPQMPHSRSGQAAECFGHLLSLVWQLNRDITAFHNLFKTTFAYQKILRSIPEPVMNDLKAWTHRQSGEAPDVILELYPIMSEDSFNIVLNVILKARRS